MKREIVNSYLHYYLPAIGLSEPLKLILLFLPRGMRVHAGSGYHTLSSAMFSAGRFGVVRQIKTDHDRNFSPTFLSAAFQ